MVAEQGVAVDLGLADGAGLGLAAQLDGFFLDFLVLGGGCLGLGVLGGVTLALNIDVVVPFIERMLGTQLFSKEVYYISSLPSELQWSDVSTITGVSFVLSLVATIYPSWRASRVNPAEALRYE